MCLFQRLKRGVEKLRQDLETSSKVPTAHAFGGGQGGQRRQVVGGAAVGGRGDLSSLFAAHTESEEGAFGDDGWGQDQVRSKLQHMQVDR
jgi:hypothetical protein